ncbi:hypothetical protein [Symbioplanes lichenis]|uniref:hypothetical protein n=1 Tax=Symbioplanes lichenis TaxID=1629072 RepID=UPI0027391B9E|nr:hypothetical protein [Actinoplanes lichenis]
MSGRVPIPREWLKPGLKDFIDLDDSAVLDEDAAPVARAYVHAVAQFSELIFRLIDAFLAEHGAFYGLTGKERHSLRRNGAAVVRDTIYRHGALWPAADPARLGPSVRAAVEQALHERLRHRAPPERPAVPPPEPPASRVAPHAWEHEVRLLVKAVVWTGAGLANAAAVSVLYLMLFLMLRRYAPDLTVAQDLLVAGVAIVASLGGLAIGWLFQMLRARRYRGRLAGERPPGGAG